MRSTFFFGAVCACVALVACNGGAAEPDPLVDDLSDLCRAVADDVELADQESAFFDRAHDAVHELATRATESDPGVGGRLLEAKQKIEAALTETFDDALPARSFDRLIDATNDALTEVDLETVSC